MNKHNLSLITEYNDEAIYQENLHNSNEKE